MSLPDEVRPLNVVYGLEPPSLVETREKAVDGRWAVIADIVVRLSEQVTTERPSQWVMMRLENFEIADRTVNKIMAHGFAAEVNCKYLDRDVQFRLVEGQHGEWMVYFRLVPRGWAQKERIARRQAEEKEKDRKWQARHVYRRYSPYSE
jgi:hypothetical protein